MEEKIINVLEQILNRLDNLEQGQASMQNDIKDLKQGQAYMQNDIKELKLGQQRIEDKIDNIEVHNANRHIEIRDEIHDMKKNITAVEVITAKNWSEIATLKVVK